MSKRPVQGQPAKPSNRRVRLSLQQLEDRVTPHAGIALHSAGITPDAGLTGIVAGPDGNVWFAEYAASRIGRIGGVGNTGPSTEFTLPAGRSPLHLTVGPDNFVYFTENTGNRIGRLNPLAGTDASIQASIQEFTVPGEGSTPHDIVTGPDGALWFTQSGSDQIGRLDPATGVITEFAVPGAGSMPSGIATGSDGALWFTQSGSGQIGRITTAGVVTEFTIPVPNAAAFSNPEDITSASDGNLYFTDFGRDTISRITTSGQITQFNLPLGRGPLQIVATADNHLYFTEAASSRIGRLPFYALNPGQPTSGAPPLKEFDFIARDSVPLGIATVGNDDIFFTLNDGNAIGAFASHLTQISIVATGPNLEVFDINLNTAITYAPFAGYTGSLNLAVRDILPPGGATGMNGIPDAVVGVATGAPHVKVFDGGLGTEMASFYAFDPRFLGGVVVGADDVNGDGFADIVVAASTHIKVIDGTKLDDVGADGQINESALLASFFAFSPGSLSGVSLAVGDLDNDGRADIAIGAGPGGSSHVKIVSGARLDQVNADGQINDSALLASFFAFDPSFTGGVFLAVPYNTVEQNLVIGAGPGGRAHVKLVDVERLGEVNADGQISDSALLASFFAFGQNFLGGVRVASDDMLNSDGIAEILVAAGPGGGPNVKVLDGARLNQLLGDGTISGDAELESFFAGGNPNFTGGVSIAADADHRDGPLFGPPGVNQPGGVAKSRQDINDVFVFQSPTNAANTVLALNVSPFSSVGTPNIFDNSGSYDIRVANRDIAGVTDDIAFRVTFGPPDPAANNQQDVQLRALPAARFPGVGGVLFKGFTNTAGALRTGGAGSQFLASEVDDQFFFDAGAFGRLINNPTGTAAGGLNDGMGAPGPNELFPFGTSPNGFGPGSTPDYNGGSFFGGSNTLNFTFEIPSSLLVSSDSEAIAVWARTEFGGVQGDRMGRPSISAVVIPPLPRGSNFPANGSATNRVEARNLFMAAHPKDDRTTFRDDVISVLTAFYPAGRPGGTPSDEQAGILADLLLADVLIHDINNDDPFGEPLVVDGTTFFAGGRKFSDDVISTLLAVITDDDLPAAFGGGPNAPVLVTQNVADDNGLNLKDGSLVGPGGPQAGMQREAVFPYIGSRNVAPVGVPGGNPRP